MSHVWLSLIVIAGTIYLVRLLPLLLLQKPIKSTFLRSFLYYVPYVTLAVMTVPAIFTVTDKPIAGAAALVVGILVALWKEDLFMVALSCVAAVFLAGMLF